MASVESNLYWMDKMLHEMGHAVYSAGHDANDQLPYLLRDSAHTFTTEGMANLMGQLASNPYWMQRFLQLDEKATQHLAPRLHRRAKTSALVFARWCMVMAYFERDLYRNPDQDINALWWRYVQKFQKVTPPDSPVGAEWASKIHLVSSPVYYHNYLLGDLFAAQLHARIRSQLFAGIAPQQVIYADSPEVGKFLKAKVFSSGAMLKWDQFVIEATGEPLSPRAYAAAFIDDK